MAIIAMILVGIVLGHWLIILTRKADHATDLLIDTLKRSR